jgi:hypothetical protein
VDGSARLELEDQAGAGQGPEKRPLPTGLGCLLPSALSNDEEQRYRKPKECESETTVRWCVRVEDRRGNRPRGGSLGSHWPRRGLEAGRSGSGWPARVLWNRG